MRPPIEQAIKDEDRDTVGLLWRQEWAMSLLQRERQYPDSRSETDPYDLLLAVIAPGEELREASAKAAEELVNGRPFVRASSQGWSAKATRLWRRTRRCWRPECGTHFLPKMEKQVYCSPGCQKQHKSFTFRGFEKCAKGHTRTKHNTGWRPSRHVEGNFLMRCLDCHKLRNAEYEKSPKRIARRNERARARDAALRLKAKENTP